MKGFTASVLLLLVGPLGTSQTLAMSQTACADKYEVFDNTTIRSVPGESGCYITVNPRNVANLTYRDFLFDDAGLFMIFNSFGPGPESETTGAREIYFFPRNVAALGFTYDAATKRAHITIPSGKVFTFSTEKAVLLSISGTTFTQDYNVVEGNNGGIEITQNDGVYLDLGFTKGQSPSQSSSRKGVFADSQAGRCEIKNSQVFKYTAEGNVIFRYDDPQLSQFLLRSCPLLKQ